MKYIDDHKTSWKSKSDRNETKWGYEIKFGSLSTVSAKVLCMKGGENTSLKYYSTKNEILFLRSGEVKIIHGCEHTLDSTALFPYDTSVLLPGECLCVQAGCPYQIFAIKNSEIFELGDCARDVGTRIENLSNLEGVEETPSINQE